MKVATARSVAKAINDAADAAEVAGQTDIDLDNHLAAMDEAARAELQAAIDASDA